MLTREAFNHAGGGILMINGAHTWSALPDGGQQVLRCLDQELNRSRDGEYDALAVLLAVGLLLVIIIVLLLLHVI